ncbi:MAG TPA: hypothetical protein VI386_35225 [Candidatus Sulfotelmatobacter sp.]
MDTLPSSQVVEKESFANRKLIRPTLPRPENHSTGNHGAHNGGAVAMPRERLERAERVTNERSNHDRGNHDRSNFDRVNHDRNNDRGDRFVGGRKPSPPEQTNAENFYYQKQMQSRTPMVIVLRDGEEVHGVIEWYDRDCIKVNRDNGAPNLMIYKPAIKYMYKEGEGS